MIMKQKGFFQGDVGTIIFRCTLWLAVIGLVLMVGIAALSSGIS
jgi:hypothetical protein